MEGDYLTAFILILAVNVIHGIKISSSVPRAAGDCFITVFCNIFSVSFTRFTTNQGFIVSYIVKNSKSSKR